MQTDSDVAKIVLESIQAMLLKIALQMARDDYEERRKRQAAGIFRAKGRLNGRKRTKIKRKLTFNLPKLIVLRLVFARFLYHLYNQIIRPLDFRLHIAL